MTQLSSILLSFLLVTLQVQSGFSRACKPVTHLMTRASGSEASYVDGQWKLHYPLSSVNLANLHGAFKYIIAEVIDKNTAYHDCHRHNKVAFIHFFRVTVCNPDPALWWFNQRPEGYGKLPAYHYGELGPFLAMDGGKCHKDSSYCSFLWGNEHNPALGPWVGYQDGSKDDRNPTPYAQWFSLPGGCPMKSHAEKTDECLKAEPSGLCKPGQVPDGEKCTWTYEVLGQAALDDVIGLTSIKNKNTGEDFRNATEFCLAGYTEFERDPKTKKMKRGLPFWRKPLDADANFERVEKLIDFYHQDARNVRLPSFEELRQLNPKCYESSPGCFDMTTKTPLCARNDAMQCIPCMQTAELSPRMKAICESTLNTTLAAFPELAPVELPAGSKQVVLPDQALAEGRTFQTQGLAWTASGSTVLNSFSLTSVLAFSIALTFY